MTRTALLTAVASTLMLAACDGDVSVKADTSGGLRVGDLTALTRLECPEREDQLTRVSAAQDGMSCLYEGEGAEVRLSLVPLNGAPADAALTRVEGELRSLLPARQAVVAGAVASDTDVVVGVEALDDQAHVRLPGLSIDAEGDRAQIRIGDSVVIDADDADSTVNIMGDDGSTLVNADEGGAEIRVTKDDDGDLHRSFKLAAADPGPNGLRVVGYEARGPASGPLVLAVLRQRGEEHDGQINDAMGDLVRKVARR